MASNHYHFMTRWRVEGTLEEVARILTDAESLSQWWPSVYLDVKQIAAGDERGVGTTIAVYTKGWLPYTLRWQARTTDIYSDGFRIEATGDFHGRGIWTLKQNGPYVDLVYDWKLRADKPLLKYFSFVLKPIFAANHRWAMQQGETSLKLELLRRRAASEFERRRIPDPPPATRMPSLPLLGVTALLAAAAIVIARRARSIDKLY